MVPLWLLWHARPLRFYILFVGAVTSVHNLAILVQSKRLESRRLQSADVFLHRRLFVYLLQKPNLYAFPLDPTWTSLQKRLVVRPRYVLLKKLSLLDVSYPIRRQVWGFVWILLAFVFFGIAVLTGILIVSF